MKINKQQLLAGAAGAVLTVGLGAGALTFASTPVASTSGSSQTTPMHQPGVGGTVTAVSGNTITVTGKNGTTYTVDASAATITKDETVSVSNIAVGDTIMANGTVNGTSVAATSIHDGKMPAGGAQGGFGGGRGQGMGGGRGVRGTVSAISGNTLTVTATNPKNSTGSTGSSQTTTYTVDASSATVLKGNGTAKPAASTLSAVAVGDTVMISGTTSGTSVTAKMIVDGPMPKWNGQKPTPGNTTTTTTQ